MKEHGFDHEESDVPISSPCWHSRGYLPHLENPSNLQHVTFHLADSMAKEVIDRFNDDLSRLPAAEQDIERRKRLEAWIDAGHGSCLLREPSLGELMQRTLLHFDAQRYRLLAWVVMPNHVHVLFQPLSGWTVGKIVSSWKSFTGRRFSAFLAEKECRECGDRVIWHREYWDRYIRNELHYQQVVDYIHNNPVKAGLVRKAGEWPWSSASHQNMRQE